MLRGVTYRLIPGSSANAARLHKIAGACRYVWNHFLGENQRLYRQWRDTERFCEDTLLGLLHDCPAKPSVSFFSLSKQFTALRAENEWLQELPYKTVRYALKR